MFRGIHRYPHRAMPQSAREPLRRTLLVCGPAASLVYIATDLTASARYPGYSLADQAVSELFAIGAPTARLVSTLFSLSSIMLLGFAGGVALSARAARAIRLTSFMFAANAIDCLALWNLFPMHMRGEPKTFTDVMHVVLAANPFVWLAPVFAALGSRGWLRWWSVAAIALLLAPTILAFRYVPALNAGAPTPGLGLAERTAQYGYQAWQAALAMELLRRGRFGARVT